MLSTVGSCESSPNISISRKENKYLVVTDISLKSKKKRRIIWQWMTASTVINLLCHVWEIQLQGPTNNKSIL